MSVSVCVLGENVYKFGQPGKTLYQSEGCLQIVCREGSVDIGMLDRMQLEGRAALIRQEEMVAICVLYLI